MLSDIEIEQVMRRVEFRGGPLKVEHPDSAPLLLQPASVDLRLAAEYLTMRTSRLGFIDPRADQTEALYERHSATYGQMDDEEHLSFYVHPGEFIIGSTEEWLEFPPDLVGRLEGKSSLGRLGLLVHSTAGFFDPGFRGTATLEIANVSPLPIKLYVGMPICQLAVDWLASAARAAYDGKYAGQRGPTPSAYYKNWHPGGPMADERPAGDAWGSSDRGMGDLEAGHPEAIRRGRHPLISPAADF